MKTRWWTTTTPRIEDRIDCKKYTRRALNYLTENYNLFKFGTQYYVENYSQGPKDVYFKRFNSILSKLWDFQHKIEGDMIWDGLLNGLIIKTCPEETEPYVYSCLEYCENSAVEINQNLSWIFSILIGIESESTDDDSCSNSTLTSFEKQRYGEILKNYNMKIYGGDELKKNCEEFLCDEN